VDVNKRGDRRRLRAAAAGIPKVAAIYGELKLVVNQAIDQEMAADPGELESAPEVLQIRDRLIEAFCRGRDLVRRQPRCSGLAPRFDRLAKCETPPNEWILGYGVFTNPWDYPPMDESFRKNSTFHSWAWLE